MTHTIDAKNKRLGRLASEIAVILQGKKNPNYEKRLEGEDKVVIKNIKELEVTGNKTENKIYYKHTGFLGNMKKRQLGKILPENPEWVLRHAVRGMLPKNRLLKKRMRRLTVE